MSTRLRLAICAALAFGGACAAAEPGETKPAAATVPATVSPAGDAETIAPRPTETLAAPPSIEVAPAPPPAVARVPQAPLLSPLLSGLSPPPPSASPLLPSLVPPAAPAPAKAEELPLDEAVAGPAVPTRTGAEVFNRLRRRLSPNACTAGASSSRWRVRYAGSPVAFARRMETVLPLLDFVSTEVERAGLPAEFTFIPLVESWYQPNALGAGGPAGMWQMIGTTAQNHGIHIRDGYDGRLSPVESTRAALSYLKVLKSMFGDWQAIVMAYNAGEGRMQNAFRRAGSRSTDASMRRPHGLSNITYDYVDKLQALSCLVSKPQLQGLRLPMDAKFVPLVPVLMEAQVDSLDEFARRHNQDPALLRKLNPGFRNGRVVAGVPRLLLSPPGAGETLAIPGAPTRPAPPPDLLAVADVSSAAPPLLVADAAGHAPELVPVSLPVGDEPAPLAPPVAAVPAAASAPPNAASPMHEVRAGETLDSIAEQYHLPPEQIQRANNLEHDARLRPGQRLRLVP